MRESVSSSLELLAYSVRQGRTFEEARALGDYIQWQQDERQWEVEKYEYEVHVGRIQASAEMAVATASATYMRQHAVEEEAAVWDWCPVWHAITGLEEIRARLPPLPFQHNGECMLETLMPVGVTVFQYYSVTVLHRYSVTVLQCYSVISYRCHIIVPF